VRSDRLGAKAENSSGTQREGERQMLISATKQRLVKIEKILCVL
jgi:hypothetical protein